MDHFHVSATGHSVNYLPEYIATWRGFFADEQLEVTASVPRPWDGVLDELASGEANAVLGGIWVPAMHLGRSTPYVAFAQVAARAPLAIVGREDANAFTWSAMARGVIAMKGSNGASVGLYIKMLLRENGIDPTAVKYIQDLDGALLSKLFSGGMADYVVIDYPAALALEAAGGGRIVAPLASIGGNVPWSVYYTEGQTMVGNGASKASVNEPKLVLQTRFCRALARGMDWILAHDASEYRDFLQHTFPRFDGDLLVSLVNSYRAIGMWTTPRIDHDAYDRWQHGIADGHLISAPIPYDDLIDLRPCALFPVSVAR